MRKGTFGHMQNVKTQTSRRVSDAASGQGQHFLTIITSMALIFLAIYVNNFIMNRRFQHRIGADLGLQYVECPKVPFRVTLAKCVLMTLLQ